MRQETYLFHNNNGYALETREIVC